MLGADLIPHAGGAADDVGVGYGRVEGVHDPPGLVDAVVDAVDVVEAGVEVDQVVVGEDDLAFAAGQLTLVGLVAPPVDHVLVLHGQVDLFVGPVYHLLRLAYRLPEQLLLLLPVVYL